MNYKLHITNYKLITHYKLKEMKTDNVIVDKSKAFALKEKALRYEP